MRFKEKTTIEFWRMFNPNNNIYYHSMAYIDSNSKSDFIVHLNPSLNKFDDKEMSEHILMKTKILVTSFFERGINAMILIKEM